MDRTEWFDEELWPGPGEQRGSIQIDGLHYSRVSLVGVHHLPPVTLNPGDEISITYKETWV